MKRVLTVFFVILGLSALVLINGLVLSDLEDIGTPRPTPPSARDSADRLEDRSPVRIGVVSRFAPNIIYASYQPIMDYLNRNGTFHYELRLSTSYQDAVDRLRDREVTASFLGAWMTSRLEPDSLLVPLLAPLNAGGASEFRTVLVCGPDSDLASLSELAGRSVALPSRHSWSGNWLQSSGLPGVGLSVAELDSVHHFDHHQTVVWQVLGGFFDAGVVKESVADIFASEGLRAVCRSAPIPGPPLVGNRRASSVALEEITRLLLALDHDDSTDRATLDSWTREFSFGFTRVDWDRYSRAFAGLEEPR